MLASESKALISKTLHPMPWSSHATLQFEAGALMTHESAGGAAWAYGWQKKEDKVMSAKVKLDVSKQATTADTHHT